MKLSLVLVICFVFICATFANEFMSATEKQKLVYNKILKSKGTAGSWPTAWQFFKFFWTDFNLSMDRLSDEMPAGRKKAIHSIGSVATAKFTSNSRHPFSGMFKGNPNLIVRLSLAKKPSKKKSAPGIAVKFFRDNLPSANFVAMFGIEGQNGGNFFENEFRNHIEAPSSIAVKLAELKFATASKFPRMVGLSDIASTDAAGNKIPTKDMNFPFQLTLVPNVDLKKKFAFAANDGSISLAKMLSSIPPGTKLYDLYGISSPDSIDRILIGSITTTSKLVSSEYGDNNLFFKHQRMEEDVAHHSDWNLQAVRKLLSSTVRCPFS